jgi:hypothetical protein
MSRQTSLTLAGRLWWHAWSGAGPPVEIVPSIMGI